MPITADPDPSEPEPEQPEGDYFFLKKKKKKKKKKKVGSVGGVVRLGGSPHERDRRIDAARERWNVLEHPFYTRWEQGDLTHEELARYAGE